MSGTDGSTSRTSGMVRTARSRGVLSGVLLIALGIWGAFVPFVGPSFSYGFAPAAPWAFSVARFWLEILPGAVVVAAGLILLLTARRIDATVAGVLAAASGAWFVVGPALWSLASGVADPVGAPLGGARLAAVEQIGMLAGLGAVIMLLAGLALGRFSVRGTRDVVAAERARDRRHDDGDRPAHDRFRDGDGDGDGARHGAGDGAGHDGSPAGARPTDGAAPTHETAAQTQRLR